MNVPLRRRAPDWPIPLTATQLDMWQSELAQKAPSGRMCAAALRITGPMNIDLLRTCLEELVRRHESLRTRIAAVDGVPRQYVSAQSICPLQICNLREREPAEGQREAMRMVQDFIDAKIDVAVDPLFEGRLLQLPGTEHVLILMLHHIIGDWLSCEILTRELWVLYGQAVRGLLLSLPELPIQFPDYAVWQQRTYASWLADHGAYWRELLNDAPHLRLSREGRLREVASPVGASRHFSLGEALSARLRELARQERTLLPLLVLAIHARVIAHWCDQSDLVVKFISNGRSHRRELLDVVGFLACILHLRIRSAREGDFLRLLSQVKESFVAAHRHHDFGHVPFLVPECVSDVYFNWMPAPRAQPHCGPGVADHGLEIRMLPVSVAQPKKFIPFFYDCSTGIGVSVNYRPDIHSAGTIEQFGNTFLTFAQEMASLTLPAR